MKKAKVKALKVRPKRSADLAFNISGIIANRNEDLSYLSNEVLSILDYPETVYEKLDEADEEGKILMGASSLRDTLKPHMIFQLYSETAAASLDQMILQRQNAYLERYKYDDERLKEIKKLFPVADGDLTGRTIEGSKLWRLRKLREADDKKYVDIKEAYEQGQPADAIKRNEVVTQQKTNMSNSVKFTEGHVVKSKTTSKSVSVKTPSHNTELKDKADKKFQSIVTPDVTSKQIDVKGADLPDQYVSQEVSTTSPEGKGTSMAQDSTVHYTEYLHPFQENILRHEQIQSDLMQEELSDALYSFRVNNLERIWKNELQALNLEVQKYQISFIRTFLIPPFPGIITTIYKDLGESVQAGEPVVRIEDNRKLLLIGLVIYRGLLKLGDTLTIRTNDLFESSNPLEIPDAKIVSIRGNDSDNDIWDIILECDNPIDQVTQKPTLPINYNFDRDNVEITVN